MKVGCDVKDKKKALILTNHMAEIAGSEIVALEISNVLINMGYKVDIHCNYLAEPMVSMLNSKVMASDDDKMPNVFEYDFVWSQHWLIASAIVQHPIPKQWKTRFVSAHLSPYEPFEMTGIFFAQFLGSQIVANSQETLLRLGGFGVDMSKAIVSYNACPNFFWVDHAVKKNTLKEILLVSNHPPAELLEALEILKSKEVVVKYIGMHGDYRGVCPEDINNVDAVISIGKTVQYAVMGATPIYCYDHFGGPGWLTSENFDLAEEFNFSGRCCGFKKNPNQIVSEILEGYIPAAEFVLSQRSLCKEKYSLDNLVKKIIHGQTEYYYLSDEQRQVLKSRLDLEGIFSAMLRRSYRNERNTFQHCCNLSRHLLEVEERNKQLESTINVKKSDHLEQIADLENTIAVMKNSRFWKIRDQWFALKRKERILRSKIFQKMTQYEVNCQTSRWSKP